jgi:hypothetical protein
VQTCGSNGNWGAAVACVSQTCVAGVCMGSCAPGSTMCFEDAGVHLLGCDSTGNWVPGVAPCCMTSCVAGYCNCTCAPGQTQCTANGVETCTSTGTWSAAVPCVDQTCKSGACVGTCAPGTVQCSDAGAQTCDSTGTWQSACDGGQCDAGIACPPDDAGTD